MNEHMISVLPNIAPDDGPKINFRVPLLSILEMDGLKSAIDLQTEARKQHLRHVNFQIETLLRHAINAEIGVEWTLEGLKHRLERRLRSGSTIWSLDGIDIFEWTELHKFRTPLHLEPTIHYHHRFLSKAVA